MYEKTKQLQKPTWSGPYAFFDRPRVLEFSYSARSYNDEGQRIFNGVLSIDYMFEDIANFLMTDHDHNHHFLMTDHNHEPEVILGRRLSPLSTTLTHTMSSQPHLLLILQEMC